MRRSAPVSQSGGASELIKARALEASREEIKELRELNEQAHAELEKVLDGRRTATERMTGERKQLEE